MAAAITACMASESYQHKLTNSSKLSIYTHYKTDLISMAGSETPDTQIQGTLSERELQIVELVAAGLTNQEISDELEISKRTVDNHISNILTKTAMGNRVALVRWALRWGKVCINDVNCCTLPNVDQNGAVS